MEQTRHLAVGHLVGRSLLSPLWPGTMFSVVCATLSLLLISLWIIDRHGCHECLFRGTSQDDPFSFISCQGYIVLARVSGRSDIIFIESVPRRICPVFFESRLFDVLPKSQPTIFWHISALGISFGRSVYPAANQVASGRPCLYVALPIPILLCCFALPMFLIMRRRVRLALRISRGQCESCGYDLRASPERCPECGLATAQGRK
jgi:hypothetical protein